ncbi:calcineurin-like phosphoesterase C-terminal domain-containing protein [Wenzhouxiangella marina]|uniref:Metallophosphoesterase n=1 Tax=Wenzhouxiangella marina TaxID=1579979 RepID=A0A0K0XTV0_9GAMM|nr:calcineurin-like phosphoesterase C-terminal domain-containing protein [Wenzhouxiangella marina]AKS41108.1 Metallophosphoesterase [Wenzhouxiangella marina]MBB6087987.1 hypothetical protein [Wenzhouxiangella marina]
MRRDALIGSLLALYLLTACAQGPDSKPELAQDGTVHGCVYHDLDGDGARDPDEPGVAGVRVSNGLDVVLTDRQGRYRLPLRDDMNLGIVQPAAWRVPLDARGVPQFFLNYRAGGSPPLRYGGLPDRSAPERVDFALLPRSEGAAERFRCVIVGDSQTYSNDEIAYFRDSAVRRLLDYELDEDDCVIYVGDVVGDDLDLLDRLLALGSTAGAPQWLVHGNHDMDLDAWHPEHSADSWRARAMPDYYAFEMGQVLFVALNNVVFPCGEADAAMDGRRFCVDDQRPRYNGRLPDTQLTWLANLLETVPKDRRVVLLHHIPLVSFSDADSPVHQTDNTPAIHALLEGRPALSVAGHTHTVENLAPGEWFEGWPQHTGVGPLPFRHLIAGAAAGSWWMGDLELDGVPMAIQHMGSPRGLLSLEFDGIDFVETYHSTSHGADRAQWVAFNTPDFRAWHAEISAWMNTPAGQRDPVPPRSINDLNDLNMFTVEDLGEGVYLTANVWLGSAETRVVARINDGPDLPLLRTQSGQGEAPKLGAEFADPFATRRLLSMSRQALVSRSGDERAQAYEAFQGAAIHPVPGPQGRTAPDSNQHLWRLRLPDDLPLGIHVAEVTSTDRHGRRHRDRLVFEVVEQRPPRRWTGEGW